MNHGLRLDGHAHGLALGRGQIAGLGSRLEVVKIGAYLRVPTDVPCVILKKSYS